MMRPMNVRTMMSIFLPEKNVSWSLLTMFFIFDNIFSYYAITRLQGREGNPLIAPFVEKYPLALFLLYSNDSIDNVRDLSIVKNSCDKILKTGEA